MSHSTVPVLSPSNVERMDDISDDEEVSRPSALIAVLTLFVGMTSGSEVFVNISNAERISASWDGVKPVAADLPDFRRFDGG